MSSSDSESSPQSEASNGSSRSQKRRSRKHLNDYSKSSNSHQKNTSSNPTTTVLTATSAPQSLPPPMPLFGSSTQKLVPVFVASLGNPAPYTTTLHSAGHTVLAALAAQQAYNPWRPFSGGKIAERSERAFNVVTGYSNAGPRRLPTLWKCGSMMNISGPAVKKAFLKWKSEQNFSDDDPKPKLVVIHDELESELGAVRVRTDPKASARGHNGLKSLMSALPNEKWIRIGVGIGRPASRERDAVSDYVLRKMNAREQAVLEQAAAEVSRQLGEIEEGAVS